MAQVPSNLIPTRVTQLPTAPIASEDGLLMFVYEGNSYKIRAGDLLSVAGVPTSRQVIAGTGMTGGGFLESNVTLSVAVGGIGSTQLDNTGVAAGVYGSEAQIPVMTVDANGRVVSVTNVPVTVTGYVPVARQVIAGTGLTGGGALNSNVTLGAALSDATPLSGTTLGSAGVSNEISRADHQHPSVDLADNTEVQGLLGLQHGGTAKSLVPDAGAVIWCGADGLYVGSAGLDGQVLVSGGTSAPTWGSALIVTDQPANVVYAGPASGPDASTSFRSLVNADLPASGVTASTYGSSTSIPVVTVNSKGVITNVTTASFTGGLSYQGSWNASTNTPTLTSSTGTSGYYYVVSVAGTTNLNGITDWQVGDWAIFNGTAWQKIDQTNLVSSVNGYTGAVVLSYSDVGAPSTSGTNATGTWGISISGNATTATSATTATNVAGGAANKIVYNTGSGTTAFIDAPVTTGHYLKWNGSAFTWDVAGTGTVTSVSGTGTVSGISLSGTVTSTGNLTLGGSLDLSSPPAIGGTSRATAAFTTELVGPSASANFTRFPNALSVISNTALGIQQNETYYIGQLAEGVSVGATWGVGVYGVGYTNSTGNGRGTGVVGEGHVSAAGDTGVAVGVRGYANDIHTGNYNIGLYGDASGGDAGLTYGGNVSLFLANGNIVTSSASVKSWYMGGDITFDGQGSAKVVSATNGAVINATTAGSATTATTATNIAGGAASQLVYQTGTGATSFIANGTAGQVLTSAGSSAPAWGGINGGTF